MPPRSHRHRWSPSRASAEFARVGLSLGATGGLRHGHRQLKNLVDRFEPSLVSDHLSWGVIDERHLNDVLPLPYTEAAIQVVCVNVVGRRSSSAENVSSYL